MQNFDEFRLARNDNKFSPLDKLPLCGNLTTLSTEQSTELKPTMSFPPLWLTGTKC